MADTNNKNELVELLDRILRTCCDCRATKAYYYTLCPECISYKEHLTAILDLMLRLRPNKLDNNAVNEFGKLSINYIDGFNDYYDNTTQNIEKLRIRKDGE